MRAHQQDNSLISRTNKNGQNKPGLKTQKISLWYSPPGHPLLQREKKRWCKGANIVCTLWPFFYTLKVLQIIRSPSSCPWWKSDLQWQKLSRGCSSSTAAFEWATVKRHTCVSKFNIWVPSCPITHPTGRFHYTAPFLCQLPFNVCKYFFVVVVYFTCFNLSLWLLFNFETPGVEDSSCCMFVLQR